MHTTPVTLLERLRHAPDEAAWQRLVKLYTPLLFFWARRAGESEHDAADLVQDVLTTLVQELPRGRDKSIRFRAWLHTVTLNKLRDRKRRAAVAHNVPLDQTFELALPDDVAAFWDAEYRQQLATSCLATHADRLRRCHLEGLLGPPPSKGGRWKRLPRSSGSAKMRSTLPNAGSCTACSRNWRGFWIESTFLTGTTKSILRVGSVSDGLAKIVADASGSSLSRVQHFWKSRRFS